MVKEIRIKDLRIGMHVCLSEQWHKHDFLKNQFVITSPEQIAKIKAYGPSITIDTAKGLDVEPEALNIAEEATSALSPIKGALSDAIMSDNLFEVIHDNSQPTHKKAEAVHRQSVIMMRHLLEQPAPENIQTAKKAFAGLVDMIFSDYQTSRYLIHITSHDYYTYTHSVAVGLLAASLAKEYFNKADAHDMYELGAGFFLHDLGKIKIDLQIINKPGRLTNEELRSIRHHPFFGFKILQEAKQLSEECKLIVMQHHERFDGTGYPLGMKGNEIHDYGQICAIADVYDALTSVRPYKQKLAPFEALMLMKKEMFGHFNTELFKHFVLMLTK